MDNVNSIPDYKIAFRNTAHCNGNYKHHDTKPQLNSLTVEKQINMSHKYSVFSHIPIVSAPSLCHWLSYCVLFYLLTDCLFIDLRVSALLHMHEFFRMLP